LRVGRDGMTKRAVKMYGLLIILLLADGPAPGRDLVG